MVLTQRNRPFFYEAARTREAVRRYPNPLVPVAVEHFNFRGSLNAKDPRRQLVNLIRYVGLVRRRWEKAGGTYAFAGIVDVFGRSLETLGRIITNWRPEYTGRNYIRNPDVVRELVRWAKFRHLIIVTSAS